MSKRIIYDVQPRDGGDWAAQRRGTERAGVVRKNKVEAIDEARRLAQQHVRSQVVIRGQNGRIEREYTSATIRADFVGNEAWRLSSLPRRSM